MVIYFLVLYEIEIKLIYKNYKVVIMNKKQIHEQIKYDFKLSEEANAKRRINRLMNYQG